MKAWVIKSLNGRYWDEFMNMWTGYLYLASCYGTKECAKEVIKENKLRSCRPVSIDISEV